MTVVIDMSVALIHLSTLPRANFHHVKKTKKKKRLHAVVRNCFSPVGRIERTVLVVAQRLRKRSGLFFSLGLTIIVNLKTKSLDNAVQEFLLA